MKKKPTSITIIFVLQILEIITVVLPILFITINSLDMDIDQVIRTINVISTLFVCEAFVSIIALYFQIKIKDADKIPNSPQNKPEDNVEESKQTKLLSRYTKGDIGANISKFAAELANNICSVCKMEDDLTTIRAKMLLEALMEYDYSLYEKISLINIKTYLKNITKINNGSSCRMVNNINSVNEEQIKTKFYSSLGIAGADELYRLSNIDQINASLTAITYVISRNELTMTPEEKKIEEELSKDILTNKIDINVNVKNPIKQDNTDNILPQIKTIDANIDEDAPSISDWDIETSDD